MSKLRRVRSAALKVARYAGKAARFIPGPIGGIARIAGMAATGLGAAALGTKLALPGMRATAMALPALPGMVAGGRALVRGAGPLARAGIGAGRALVRKYPKSARALAELGLFAAGGMVFDAVTGEPVGIVARRRMNPLNHRALRRAISRVCSARRICAQVEQIAGPRRRRVCAPRKRCPPRRS